jgi:hypothetical protein
MILMQVQPPPDNTAYMIAGFTIIFGVMIIYVASLILRHRSLMRDLELLEELDDQDV